MSLRRVASTTAIVILTMAVVYLLWIFRQALALFAFSLAVAAATRPYVEILSSRGVRRSLAIVLVYVLFLGFLVLLMVAAESSFLRELQQLSDSMARTYDRMWAEWPEGSEVQKAIIQQMPAPSILYESFSPERANSALSGLLGVTVGGANLIGQLATVLILSIYWSIDRVHFERLWLSLLPVESRARSRDIWRNIERDFGAYVRSEVLQSIFAGLLLWLGLWAMGVKSPTLLALFGALAWLIPWLGGILALVPIALTGFSQSIGLGIAAFAFAIGVLILLEFFIEPRFIRRGRFSSLLSILLIIALVEPFGLLGLLIAPPLAAAIELLFRYNLQVRPVPLSTESAERMHMLRARVEAIQETIANSPDPVEPQIASMLNRLEDLVDRADDTLREKQPEARGAQVRAPSARSVTR